MYTAGLSRNGFPGAITGATINGISDNSLSDHGVVVSNPGRHIPTYVGKYIHGDAYQVFGYKHQASEGVRSYFMNV